ncbi:MAG: hypothetical protein ACXWJB_13980 [Limisphaerales bacterium]
MQARKSLLIAESEINRAEMLHELQEISGGVRALIDRVKSVGSLASAATLLVSAFPLRDSQPPARKSSWVNTLFKGAKLAGSVWLAWRSRRS